MLQKVTMNLTATFIFCKYVTERSETVPDDYNMYLLQEEVQVATGRSPGRYRKKSRCNVGNS